MILSEEIKNYNTILFDLGGVIADLDYNNTIKAFQEKGCSNFHEIYSQALQTDLFDKYETGQISSPFFINKLKELIGVDCSPNEIVAAWNAMIKGFTAQKLDFLLQLKQEKTVGLLSNINDIHEEYANRKMLEITDRKLVEHFDFMFFSHHIHLRKPHPETFLYVCEQMQVKPQDVLFIDDSQQHVEGAKKAGLNAILFPQNAPFL